MTYPAPISQPAGKRTSNNGISANYTKRGRIATGLTFALGYVVVLWLVHLVNTFIFGGVLTNFGIHPLDFNGLLEIGRASCRERGYGWGVTDRQQKGILRLLGHEYSYRSHSRYRASIDCDYPRYRLQPC